MGDTSRVQALVPHVERDATACQEHRANEEVLGLLGRVSAQGSTRHLPKCHGPAKGRSDMRRETALIRNLSFQDGKRLPLSIPMNFLPRTRWSHVPTPLQPAVLSLCPLSPFRGPASSSLYSLPSLRFHMSCRYVWPESYILQE